VSPVRDIVSLAIEMIIMSLERQDRDECRGCQDRLENIEILLAGISQECPIPQLIIDKSHRVIFWNQALEAYTGIDAKSIIGTRDQWRAFYDHPRPIMADLLVDQALSEIPRWYSGKYRQSRLIEGAYEATDYFPHIGKGGTWLYFTAAPIRNPAGQIIGALETLEDVTERKCAEEALQDAKAQAELYLDLMGHDINNFNQVGIGFLEMALDRLKLSGADREMIAKPLEMMQESSRLIANVKKLQRARSAETRLVPVDLGSVLSDVVSRYRQVPGRDITIDYVPCQGCEVIADDLLKDVFDNIVGNAVKHSEWPLTIRVTARRMQKDGKACFSIAIEDIGPGITDAIKRELTTLFQRGTTKKIGRGLGLYLVKTLIESYHGDITVEDRVPGDYTKGTRFIVTLPAAH
jgi:PAS domain S-box-containing protein